MGCSVAPMKHRLRLLLFLCCAVCLCWGSRALAQDSTTPSPRDAPPGDTPPGNRTAGPASPAGADADASSSDHADASADAEQPSFGYRVNGHMFSIEGTRGQRSVLGTTRLPRPGREPPLILGKAAYVVLPGDGLAVVDIGLARFPYVVWRLSPDLAVRSINLDGNTLRVTTWRGTLQYDVSDPLQPRGPNTFVGEPRRYYAPDQATGGTQDVQWEEQGPGWPQTGRRVYLRDGSVILGTFRGHDIAQDVLTLEVLGQRRRLSTTNIVHIEAVYFGEVGTGSRPGVASPGSRAASKAAAALIGVPLVLVYSAIIVSATVLTVTIFVCGLPVPYVGSTRC